jgi:hypothetical protein
MQENKYQFRCSSLGNIVTKSGKLTDGAKTYIQEQFIANLYGVRKEAYGKALEKGIATEQDIIDLLNKCLFPGKFVPKNKERKSNDYIHGECDVIMDGIIYDAKSAWDRFTFGKASLTHIYEWQLKGYMWLYGVDRARLFYGLVNLPEAMLYNELKGLFYRHPGRWLSMESNDFIEAAKEFEAAHNYDNIPMYQRFKIWDLILTDEDVSRMIQSVEMAREYMQQLLVDHTNMITNNRKLMGV